MAGHRAQAWLPQVEQQDVPRLGRVIVRHRVDCAGKIARVRNRVTVLSSYYQTEAASGFPHGSTARQASLQRLLL